MKRAAPYRCLTAAALALGSACATTPAQLRYQPPPAAAVAAEVVAAGAFGVVATVDGQEAPAFSPSTRLAPGVHRVGINCLFTSSEALGLPQKILHGVAAGAFVAGQRYYVRCTVEDGKPRVFLSASPQGPPLAGFE